MTKKLTERRAADRIAMAEMIERLCDQYGATHERTVLEDHREVWVDIVKGDARIGIIFDGQTPSEILDHYCMPWNTVGEGARMTEQFGLAAGGEVNPHHRAKCMMFAPGIHALLARLTAVFEVIDRGLAFETELAEAA